MTKFEDEARIFAELTNHLTDLSGSAAVNNLLPTVGMNGASVGLNSFEGEDLRSELMDAYAMTAHDMCLDGFLAEQDRDEAGRRITDGLERILEHPSHVDALEHMHAVQGLGLFGVPNSDGETSGAQILRRTQTLFGRLIAVVYGEYWRTEPGAIDAHLQGSEQLQATNHAGVLLCMSEVQICDSTEPYGPVEQDYEFALLPIHVEDFRFFRAYPKL